jgi:hypothetical protein
MTSPAARRSAGVAFLSPDDPRWGGALAGLQHDVYQLPEYVAFAARHQEPGDAMAFLAEAGDRRLLVPLIIRQVPSEVGGLGHVTDATSPRGFAGPVVAAGQGPDADAFTDEALASFVTALREHGIVSAFIRLHPLIGPSADLLLRHGEIVGLGDSFSIDLDRPEEDLWAGMRLNHRRDILRATKAGYVARTDDAWMHFEAFVRAFGDSMERLGAAPHWRLSHAYLSDLREALGERLSLCVVELAGELAAAALITEADGIAEYHLAATFHAHVRASPSKLLIRHVGDWARARGDRLLHLAGSPRPGDSLSRFKAGFGARRHAVHAWRVVPNRAVYDDLVRERASRTSIGAEPAVEWFPAYRAPVGARVR